ncbi:hypothetical protein EN868_11690 [Mesorhizobium sp. M2D.F.Ca.ET.225.01.1.1]|uniref:hypothetical protein n=1 Tax=unclassified Mesorhizobium TaxID=325217 RepID=UPI000FD47E3B|nr:MULTISPECIES: hypothetical protein [unclassified Mesorhizobium]TGP55778.1 hypothetical protein EN869_025500 [Mesorhizobium sp. M2D.F.Ca.ET.226.01.1.1]TGP68236.1 hypothetical protein EN868_11690 [Mesorhizobium sp. M2D.F.Ca.ET.225.01.1.1]
MPFRAVDIVEDPMAVMAVSSLIGLFRIRDSRGDPIDPESIGSGTLMRMPGDVYGILTAAHVLDELPDEGMIGYLTFTRQDSRQQTKIDVQLTDKTYAPGWQPGIPVPDIGFLEIKDKAVIETIRARGCSFFDFGRDRQVESDKVGVAYYATGVVNATRVEILETAGTPKITGYTAMAGYCPAVDKLMVGDCKVLSVMVDTNDPPETYGGVSGGGLWLFLAPDGDAKRAQRFFIGVLFFESDQDANGNRVLHAHSLADIDRLLLPHFQEKAAMSRG